MKHDMTKSAGSASSLKYKNLDEYLVVVRTEDDKNKASFLNDFNALVTTLNDLETTDAKNSSSDISIQELTNRIQSLIASVSTETLLRWFPKA